MTDTTGTDTKDYLGAIGIKAPQFTESSAQGWFAIMEAQFVLKNITVSSTKFYNALAALPPDLVVKLPGQILEAKDYDHLKKEVISIYEATKPELFSQLINETKMTGKPSLYLQELLCIAKKVGVGEDLVRHRFIKSLPQSISPVIAAQQDLPLSRLGKMADELIPLLHKEIYAVTPPPRNSYSNGIPIGLRPYREKQRPNICRGHIYYASKSNTCKPWCRWPDKQNCKIHPTSRASSPAPQTQSRSRTNSEN